MGSEGELVAERLRRKDCKAPSPPAILGLQLSALIDHVARVDWSLLDRIPGDRGVSQQSQAVDATSVGDLFASGFVYCLVNEFSLEDCCKAGSCRGGSLVGEVRPENWKWMYEQMQNKGLLLPNFTK